MQSVNQHRCVKVCESLVLFLNEVPDVLLYLKQLTQERFSVVHKRQEV